MVSLWLGHFRVPPGLCIKTRLSAQPFIWKRFCILLQIKLIFRRKVVHLASFWKWGFLELGSDLLRSDFGFYLVRIINHWESISVCRMWSTETLKIYPAFFITSIIWVRWRGSSTGGKGEIWSFKQLYPSRVNEITSHWCKNVFHPICKQQAPGSD